MKKTLLVLLLASVPFAAFAHPPKSVDLSYDPATQQLTIVVTHLIKQSPVTDPKRHYVKDIAVLVNGQPAVDALYRYQEFDGGETIIFKLNLKAGDKVSVTATCSIAGSKTSELTIKGM
jgi:hypothetical protein